jgi:hypothetical protein
MGKLRDEKRALRFSKGKGGDEDDFKAAKPKPKHTKHSIFEDGATKLKPGALAAGASDAGKGKRSASANVGQGPKRARDDETSADARGGYAEPKPGTGGRKAAGRARLAAAGPGGKGAPAAAPREKKALVRAVLPLWEELRDSKTSGEARIKLVADVLATLDETLLNVCVKHDAARVVQVIARWAGGRFVGGLSGRAIARCESVLLLHRWRIGSLAASYAGRDWDCAWLRAPRRCLSCR